MKPCLNKINLYVYWEVKKIFLLWKYNKINRALKIIQLIMFMKSLMIKKKIKKNNLKNTFKIK